MNVRIVETAPFAIEPPRAGAGVAVIIELELKAPASADPLDFGPSSVMAEASDGAKLRASLMFFAGAPDREVLGEATSLGGLTLIGVNHVRVGDRRLTPPRVMLFTQSGGGVSYASPGRWKSQIIFAFPPSTTKLVRLHVLGRSLPLP